MYALKIIHVSCNGVEISNCQYVSEDAKDQNAIYVSRNTLARSTYC